MLVTGMPAEMRAMLLQRLHHADHRLVVACDQGGRGCREPQHRHQRLPRVRHGFAALDQQVGIEADTMQGQRLPVGADPLDRGRDPGLAADHADAAMAQPGQVIDQPAAGGLHVLHAGLVEPVGDEPVHQHRRHPVAYQAEQGQLGLDGVDQVHEVRVRCCRWCRCRRSSGPACWACSRYGGWPARPGRACAAIRSASR